MYKEQQKKGDGMNGKGGGGVQTILCTKMTFPVYLICFSASRYVHKYKP